MLFLIALTLALLLGGTYFLWPFDGRYYVAAVVGRNQLEATINGNLLDACCEPVQSIAAQVRIGETVVAVAMLVTWWGSPLKAYTYDFDFIYSKDQRYAVIIERAHPTRGLFAADLEKRTPVSFEEVKAHFPSVEYYGYLED